MLYSLNIWISNRIQLEISIQIVFLYINIQFQTVQ